MTHQTRQHFFQKSVLSQGELSPQFLFLDRHLLVVIGLSLILKRSDYLPPTSAISKAFSLEELLLTGYIFFPFRTIFCKFQRWLYVNLFIIAIRSKLVYLLQPSWGVCIVLICALREPSI